MQNYKNSYSHIVPISIKIVCSIFMWFPLIVSFISLWYLPFITIHKQWKSWQKNVECQQLSDSQDILHIVIIPVYREDPRILDDTLQSLAQQNVSMLIGIALEERESDREKKYEDIIRKYEKKFVKLITTIHPIDLPNEIRGKTSNCDYCARALVQYYENYLKDSYDYLM